MKTIQKANVMFIAIMLAFLFLPIKTMNAMSKNSHSSLYDNPRVLIMSGTKDDIEKQIQIFIPEVDAITERDIIVLSKVTGEENLSLNEKISAEDFLLDNLDFYNQYVSDLKTPFRLILIGKDEGVKKEWSMPVSFEDIAGIIDAMPMRIREAQDQ